MYKIAVSASAITIIAAISYFQTTEPAGLFAIAWMGGLAYAAAFMVTKTYSSKS